MQPILQVFIFAFGTVIGSFLNAVVWRLRTRESYVTGRSYCPHCRHLLAPLDLVPLLSFLMLRGKCRYCSGKICISYFVVEFVVGLSFLLASLRFLPLGQTPVGMEALLPLLSSWYLIAMMTIVFVYDLRYMLILRSVTLPATVIMAVANLALGMSPWKLLGGIAVCAGFFWMQRFLSRGRWIGGGDVHLGILMGAALGFPLVLVAMLMAYVSGAAVGVSLLLLRRKAWRSELPFGTFLAAATVIAALYGNSLLNWYFGLI